jgi:hypothetical protein
MTGDAIVQLKVKPVSDLCQVSKIHIEYYIFYYIASPG